MDENTVSQILTAIIAVVSMFVVLTPSQQTAIVGALVIVVMAILNHVQQGITVSTAKPYVSLSPANTQSPRYLKMTQAERDYIKGQIKDPAALAYIDQQIDAHEAEEDKDYYVYVPGGNYEVVHRWLPGSDNDPGVWIAEVTESVGHNKS
jgi:phage-related tail fiber protein